MGEWVDRQSSDQVISRDGNHTNAHLAKGRAIGILYDFLYHPFILHARYMRLRSKPFSRQFDRARPCFTASKNASLAQRAREVVQENRKLVQ